ncbi:hypothetical protein EJB05_09205, partial [Eragrostis curvula]
MEEEEKEAPLVTTNLQDASSPTLPTEITTEEILAQLPAKSAGRFRCVCRAWLATLTSDYFVDLHANTPGHHRHPNKLLLTAAGSSSYDGFLHSWQPGAVEKLMPDDFSDGAVVPVTTKPCRAASSSSEAKAAAAAGTARRGRSSRWCVFSGTPSPRAARCSSSTRRRVGARLLNRLPCAGNHFHATEQALREKKPAVFLHGRLHFLCDDGGVMTFDISDETFGSLPPPPRFEDTSSVITELDGCLCLCYEESESEDVVYHVCVLRDYKGVRWETLCRIDQTTWSEPERALLDSYWIAPLCMYQSDGGRKKIMHVRDWRLQGVRGGAAVPPQILFTPDDTIIGSCDDDDVPSIGIFHESLVPVGRTIEEMISASPTAETWFHILERLPTRSVLELSLVCREGRAMVTTDRFVQSHVVHANLNKSPRIKIVVDPRFAPYVDLKEFVDGREPALHLNFVCSQPCHGLNVGSYICLLGLLIQPCNWLSQASSTIMMAPSLLAASDWDTTRRLTGMFWCMSPIKRRTWKQDTMNCNAKPVAATPPTFVDGKIYWMVEPSLGPVSATCEIVAFDVETEEFEVLQGPPCTHPLGQYRAFFLANTQEDCRLVEFGLDYLSENTTPLVIDPKDGRILLSADLSLGYYDPETAALETIYTVGIIPNDGYKLCPIICHESLICPLDQ